MKLLFIIIYFNLINFNNCESKDKLMIDNYYKCLSNQLINNLYHLNRHSIICYKRNDCTLLSSTCHHYSTINYRIPQTKWKRQCILSKNKISTTILDEIGQKQFQNRITTDDSNNLIIKYVDESDECIYSEVIYQTTIINQYHVTVRYPPIRKPLLKESTNNFTTIQWGEWSDCKLGSKNKTINGLNGFRIRFGDCYVTKIEKKSKNSEFYEIIQKYISNLLYYYNGSIPCGSSLISNQYFKTILTSKTNFNDNLIDYIQYENCFVNKNNQNDDNLKITKNNESIEFELLKANLISNEEWKSKSINFIIKIVDDKLSIECKDPYKDINYYLNIKSLAIVWLHKTVNSSIRLNNNDSKKYTINNSGRRLDVLNLNKNDSGFFYCFTNGTLLNSYQLSVIERVPNDTIKQFSLLGVFAVISSLLAVFILVCLNEKCKKRNKLN
jgi:hypothetical protein